MKWSLIICTRNRAHDVNDALGRVISLDYQGDEYEVIVVDNASTDNTEATVKSQIANRAGFNYIKEEKLGLSHARNRGIASARGDFIAFIDDDAWPDENWLQKLDEGFKDPKVACVGGKVVPFFEGTAGWPDWLHPRLYGFFTVVDYGDGKRLHYPNYPAGTNMAFRRAIFKQVGLFRHDLGRIGESLLSMEETDLCLRVEGAGYSIEFLPDAVVHHKVHEERLSREWIRQRSYWQGVSAAVLDKDFGRGYIVKKTLKYLVFLTLAAIGEIGFRLIGNYKNALFCSCQAELCRGYLGRIWEGIRGKELRR